MPDTVTSTISTWKANPADPRISTNLGFQLTRFDYVHLMAWVDKEGYQFDRVAPTLGELIIFIKSLAGAREYDFREYDPEPCLICFSSTTSLVIGRVGGRNTGALCADCAERHGAKIVRMVPKTQVAADHSTNV